MLHEVGVLLVVMKCMVEDWPCVAPRPRSPEDCLVPHEIALAACVVDAMVVRAV